MPSILVINPNSTTSITKAIEESLAPIRALTSIEIDCVDIPTAPSGIESQLDVENAAMAVARVCEASSADAMVVACFSDPGVFLARERTGKPVVGVAESAYLHALTLGTNFGVIAILERAIPRHIRAIRQIGLQDFLAGDRAINVRVADLDGAEVVDKITEVGRRLRDEDGAQTLILGCSGMARYRAEIADRLGIPVIDPTLAAVVRTISQLMLSAPAQEAAQ